MDLEIIIINSKLERRCLYDVAYLWDLKNEIQMNLSMKQTCCPVVTKDRRGTGGGLD